MTIIRCKLVKIRDPKLANFYKECMTGAGVQFFVNIGNFGVPYYYEFATRSYETSQIYSIRYDKSSGEVYVFVWMKKSEKRDNGKKVH